MGSDSAPADARGVEVLDLLLAVSALLAEDTAEFAAREGMTPARLHLLWELATEKAMPPNLLADRLDVAPRTVTGLVDRLAASGHVTRAPHPEDRRSALVVLTPRGEVLTERLRRMRADLARRLFDEVPASRVGALRGELGFVLGRLQRLLDAPGGAADSRRD